MSRSLHMPVRAHAPGSVTTVFVPQDAAASLGVSFATADGVTATVERASESEVYVDERPIRIDPVQKVLDRLNATATVHLELELPLGYGFGVSGAATLATALATNECLRLGFDRDALVEASHRAEVAAGTGLGDVFIQNEGGLVWDLGDGRKRVRRSGRIEYAAYGEIATAEVLGNAGAMERVREAGREALTTLDPRGSLATLFEASWRFAERTGLATDRVAGVVADVCRKGGMATMAMIGETVIATGVEGVLDHETQIDPAGAKLC